MRGSLIFYLKGMRIMMFQLSGFYCTLPTVAKPVGFGGARGFSPKQRMFGDRLRVQGLRRTLSCRL